VDTKPDPTSSAEIGVRLVLTRKALGYAQATMTRLIGVDGQTLALYEEDRRRIPANQALKLSAYGIPLDWIYQGRMADLHPHIRAKIRELQREGAGK
jgi:transcriptional regulator with XRE-family HTH domain